MTEPAEKPRDRSDDAEVKPDAVPPDAPVETPEADPRAPNAPDGENATEPKQDG